ncbi:MAG: hypothetical protein R2800_10940 [Flavipsychrobacter sp.]
MAAVLFSQYSNYSLRELINKLDKDYYQVLNSLCENASLHANTMQEEGYSTTSLYVSMAIKLLQQIKDLLTIRTAVIFPYVNELNEKVREGHDCRNCSGNCHAGHNMHLTSLKGTHKNIKEILFRLQMVASPLYANNDYPASYKILRNEVTIIDTILTELFYLEESALIPKVMEAQKQMHA